MKGSGRILKVIALLAGALLVVLLPFVLKSNYHLHLLVMVSINTILASSLNLVLGYAGNASLCHGALYGIGAYTAAILSTSFGFSPWLGLAAGAAMAFLLALPVGIASLPFRGVYFAVATLGFQQIINLVTVNWIGLTRGPMGITNISPFRIGSVVLGITGTALLAAILALCCIGFCWLIVRSRVGMELRAIRDNEVAAKSIGMNTYWIKNLVFCVSAAMAGIAGGLFAHYTGYVSPNSFTINVSVTTFIMVLAGGIGTLGGGALGAILLTLLPEVMRPLQDYRMTLYGLALVVLIIFLPKGLIGLTFPRKIKDGNSAGEGQEDLA